MLFRRTSFLILWLLSGCASEDKPELLVFTSPHCVFCQEDESAVAKLQRNPGVRVWVLTAGKSDDKFDEWGVTSTPTYVLRQGGVILLRTHHKRHVVDWLRSNGRG